VCVGIKRINVNGSSGNAEAQKQLRNSEAQNPRNSESYRTQKLRATVSKDIASHSRSLVIPARKWTLKAPRERTSPCEVKRRTLEHVLQISLIRTVRSGWNKYGYSWPLCLRFLGGQKTACKHSLWSSIKSISIGFCKQTAISKTIEFFQQMEKFIYSTILTIFWNHWNEKLLCFYLIVIKLVE